MPPHSNTRRPLLHYAVMPGVIGVYGIQVCPFIESLSPLQVLLPLYVFAAVQYAMRSVLARRLISSLDYKQQIARVFQMEYALFLFAGMVLLIIVR